MADAIKSVLFVDYDSLYRALHEADAEAADRLAARTGAWIAAFEQGRLAPSADSSLRRRVLMRRCYANPALLGDKRRHFTGNGFLVVDCPPLEGHERSAADIQMALDTIDALEHPTAYDEFILLSADTDLGPVLIRLRAHNRQTVVYATPGTPESYTANVDGTVDQEPFIALLTAADEPKIAEPAAARPAAVVSAPSEATPSADRTEIEALARKVHAATNVPLFSPKSYLELFRVLAAEIAENGYHFQSTAENVAAKLTASGRNATRRQIVFIVKGLALKGHVFSNTDTPERLADVFREQVLYLIRNAGLELTPREIAIMPAWIIGRAGSAAAIAESEPEISQPEPAPAPIKAASVAKSPESKPPARPAEDQATKAGKKKPGKPGPLGRGEMVITPPPRPSVFGAAKTSETAKPTAPARTNIFSRSGTPTPAKPNPFSATKTLSGTQGGQTKAAPPTAAVSPASAARQAIAPTKPATSKPVAEKPTPQEKPAAEKPSAATDKDAVESTILAAIAQAVDVLVEDSSAAKAMEKESEETARSDASSPSGPAPATASDVPPPDSDDIGDEIQRIIATYNRDRQQSD